MSRTHKRVPSFEVLLRHFVAFLVHQFKWTTHLRPANALGRLGYPFSLHPLFLTPEVPNQATAGEDEEKAGFP
jgi:hypothetical protein